ncbi:hypothetical protein [Roseibium sp.]|uniref:hypothetical protein n=1 Tax=Roseibium sp. TaxID=1936156 RepID=UPI003B51F6CC
MDFADSLLAKAVIFLGSIFVIAGWVKTYLLWRIDPENRYHIKNIAGGSLIDRSKENIPEKMIIIERECNRVRKYAIIVFVAICVYIVLLKAI